MKKSILPSNPTNANIFIMASLVLCSISDFVYDATERLYRKKKRVTCWILFHQAKQVNWMACTLYHEKRNTKMFNVISHTSIIVWIASTR